MALTMLVGVITTLVISEPDIEKGGATLTRPRIVYDFFRYLRGCYWFYWLLFCQRSIGGTVKTATGAIVFNNYLAATAVELFRLTAASITAALIAKSLIVVGMVEQKQVDQAT